MSAETKPKTLSRRSFAAATALASCMPLSTIAAASRKTAFVLVPGTWHGGWVYRPLVETLVRRGHRAIAATCTGVGERAHLISPEVGLDTHVTDVSSLIEQEQLDDVVLLGHSFGGITITGVCDRLRERIRHVVFLDAFIPTRERPAWVMRDTEGQWPAWWEKRLPKFIDGYKMNFFAEYNMKMLLDPTIYPEIAESVRQRLTLHPAKQWTDPVSFANGGWETVPRSYIHCSGQQYRQTSAAMYGAARQPGWNWYELPTQRLAMLTHTETVADLLEHIASDQRKTA